MHELWGMLRCEDRWIFVKKICCQQPRPHSFPCQPDIFCLLFWLWLLIYGTLSHQELHKALMQRPTRLQSPLPVNVWNKWLLQWRQTPRTTVSHLISQLHERLFVLHRVCHNQPVFLGEFGWTKMTAQKSKFSPAYRKDEDQSQLQAEWQQ